MRKDKLYLLTFLSVTLIYLILALVATNFFVRHASRVLIDTQLSNAKKEASTFSALIENELNNTLSKENLASNIQQAIMNTNQDNVFLSVLDWSGKIVCHPEIKYVSATVDEENAFVSSITDNLTSEKFYTLFESKKSASGAEIVSMYPVRNSDWIIASHMNTAQLKEQIQVIKNRFHTIFTIIGLIIIPSFVISTRFIGSQYENRLETQKEDLENRVFNLSKLNRAVGDYKEKVIKGNDSIKTKKRILTQLSNEFLPVPIENIAHIYTENTITYVTSFDGKRSTTNSSLDELTSQLDGSLFFRANRQYIIAISSINKIVKYGNNQLKILVAPKTEKDILISKNKAAEFKNWLNL